METWLNFRENWATFVPCNVHKHFKKQQNIIMYYLQQIPYCYSLFSLPGKTTRLKIGDYSGRISAHSYVVIFKGCSQQREGKICPLKRENSHEKNELAKTLKSLITSVALFIPCPRPNFEESSRQK